MDVMIAYDHSRNARIVVGMALNRFGPCRIGFAEGLYAGWGTVGSAAAAMTIPTVARGIYGGDDGWRYAIAADGAHASSAAQRGRLCPAMRIVERPL